MHATTCTAQHSAVGMHAQTPLPLKCDLKQSRHPHNKRALTNIY